MTRFGKLLRFLWTERHIDEFPHPADFNEYRHRVGGFLLLPKSFNASYGGLPYEEKLPHYNGQNLLARSLHPKCYEHNPGFLQYIEQSGLPFEPHEEFKRELEAELREGRIPREAYLGTLLTLRRGIGAEKGYAEWCDEAAEMISSASPLHLAEGPERSQ